MGSSIRLKIDSEVLTLPLLFLEFQTARDTTRWRKTHLLRTEGRRTPPLKTIRRRTNGTHDRLKTTPSNGERLNEQHTRYLLWGKPQQCPKWCQSRKIGIVCKQSYCTVHTSIHFNILDPPSWCDTNFLLTSNQGSPWSYLLFTFSWLRLQIHANSPASKRIWNSKIPYAFEKYLYWTKYSNKWIRSYMISKLIPSIPQCPFHIEMTGLMYSPNFGVMRAFRAINQLNNVEEGAMLTSRAR